MPHPLPTSPDPAAAFIARWGPSGGGERANYQIFLSELCDLLAVARPEPSGPDDRDNAYVFERHVHFDHGDGTGSTGRIDLYKRGCFVLEAKQGSAAADGAQPMLLAAAPTGRKKKGTAVRGSTAWDEAMERARGQAEQYVRALPASEHNPPFVVVVDVGHTIELYADFSRLGKTYTPFPDSQSHRLHDDLDAAVAEAYGWPVDLPDEEILRRLVALNAERAEEERRGIIRWLRPEFQNPTGAKPMVQGDLALPAKDAKGKAKPAGKTAWPATLPEQARAVRAALAARAVPATPRELAKAFKGDRIDRVAELLATLASLGQARPTDDGRFAA